MKIEGNNFNPQPAAAVSSAPVRAGESPVRSGGTAGGAAGLDADAMHLSQAALLASASATQPEVRTEKVAAVQQALASGSYAVSASDVAGKLIDHMLQN